ncbi:MAG TPA: hypothetical protein VMF30_11495 [Pirellulales bacterium]|nr:hypothetical protein [Pirellulales bacterium]
MILEPARTEKEETETERNEKLTLPTFCGEVQKAASMSKITDFYLGTALTTMAAESRKSSVT